MCASASVEGATHAGHVAGGALRGDPSRLNAKHGVDPFKAAVDEILLADLDAPRKQRHTITRIYQRLLDAHAMTGVSYPVLQRHVKDRRPEILAETGRAPRLWTDSPLAATSSRPAPIPTASPTPKPTKPSSERPTVLLRGLGRVGDAMLREARRIR